MRRLIDAARDRWMEILYIICGILGWFAFKWTVLYPSWFQQEARASHEGWAVGDPLRVAIDCALFVVLLCNAVWFLRDALEGQSWQDAVGFLWTVVFLAFWFFT
jgi:hypothetical protein